jgi:peptidoglycan hydrolase-like protein with peptidoglycan-binding domain
MVLKAQQWVNATYGSVAGYNRCAEDGSTGWQTIYSLTRALQHELGITALSDNFGPTTYGNLTAYGNVGVGTVNLNLKIIAEAALYCKGYSGGSLDGSFLTATQYGLTALVTDMGLYTGVIVTAVTPKVFKALLTMDAYVMLSDGYDPIRVGQQWMNANYVGRGQYYIGPCDGMYSRNMQKQLVLAIQYELGMSDSVVTGTIGPGTKAGLQSSASNVGPGGGSVNWIRLFQIAMACNRYNPSWGSSGGTWSDGLTRSELAFQLFCKLDQNVGANYDTWMSLLVSTGNPDRTARAIDVMYPLNSATIATVKAQGYQFVGRYLTGGTQKILTSAEIALIFDNDMSFFPLYQEFGDAVGYFSYDQGVQAARAAYAAAQKIGVPEDTVIYFSVDFDALDSEIDNYVIPHFRGIFETMSGLGTRYSIGVYGCRNTCSKLADAGYAYRSFVSGMSTGYSGNLGYKLPDNWAFDQIQNTTIGSGTGGLEIDRDVVSGLDFGVSSVTRPRDPNDAFLAYLLWIEARASDYLGKFSSSYSKAELAAQWLRLLDPDHYDIHMYGVNESDVIFGECERDFIDFVKTQYIYRPDLLPAHDPVVMWDTDPAHFGAVCQGVITHGYPGSASHANGGDFGGWGGDLLSVLGQTFEVYKSAPATGLYSYAKSLIGKRGTGSYFGLDDFISDVDAAIMGIQVRADRSLLLSDLFRSHYADKAAARYKYQDFYGVRFGGNPDTAAAAARAMLTDLDDSIAVQTVYNGFWFKDFGDTSTPTPGGVPDVVRSAVVEAWVDFLEGYVS